MQSAHRTLTSLLAGGTWTGKPLLLKSNDEDGNPRLAQLNTSRFIEGNPSNLLRTTSQRRVKCLPMPSNSGTAVIPKTRSTTAGDAGETRPGEIISAKSLVTVVCGFP